MINSLLLALTLLVPPSDTTKHHSVGHNIIHAAKAWAPLVLSASALAVVVAYPRPHQLTCKMTMTVVPPVVGQPYGAAAESVCQ